MPFHTFNKYGPSHPANIYQLRKDQIFLLLSSFCHSLAQHNSLLTSFEWKLIFQSWFIDIYTVSRGTCNHNLSTLKDLSNPQINNYAIRSGSFTISESREFLKSPSWHQSISDLFSLYKSDPDSFVSSLNSPYYSFSRAPNSSPFPFYLRQFIFSLSNQSYYFDPSYLSLPDKLHLFFRSRAIPLSLSFLLNDLKLDHSSRRDLLQHHLLNNITSNFDDFDRFFWLLLPHLVPSLYIEYLKSILDRLNHLSSNLRALYLSSAFLEPLNIVASLCRSSGKKVYIHQHGGGYFMLNTNSVDEHEQLLSTNFLSWGLNTSPTHSTGGIVRPPKRVVNQQIIKRTKLSRICFVLTAFPPVYYRCAAFPQSHDYLHYISFLQQSILSLNSVFHGLQFGIRLYSTDYENNISRWSDFAVSHNLDLHAYFPDSSLDLITDSIRYSLCICTTPTTVLSLFSQYSYQPFILLMDLRLWEPSPEYLLEFSYFYDVGLFHSSSSSLVEMLSAIEFDIDSWWQSPQIRSARLRLQKLCASPRLSISALFSIVSQ